MNCNKCMAPVEPRIDLDGNYTCPHCGEEL